MDNAQLWNILYIATNHSKSAPTSYFETVFNFHFHYEAILHSKPQNLVKPSSLAKAQAVLASSWNGHINWLQPNGKKHVSFQLCWSSPPQQNARKCGKIPKYVCIYIYIWNINYFFGVLSVIFRNPKFNRSNKPALQSRLTNYHTPGDTYSSTAPGV